MLATEPGVRTLDAPTVLAEGPTLRLVKLEQTHLADVHRMMSHPEIGRSWRSRGALLGPQQVSAFLSRDVLASAVAVRRGGDELVGLVEALDPSFVDRRAQLSALVADPYLSTGISVEMGLLFLGWLFEAFPIDKVQLEVLASNRRLVPGLHRLISHEGTLVRHVNVFGEWCDLEVFAVWRQDMERLTSALLPRPSFGAVA